MQQVALTLRPLHTTYRFEQAGVRLEVQFFTPSFPRNLDVLSRPVTYLTWTVQATDGKPHDVDLMLDVDPRIAVNEDVQAVTWGRSRTKDLTLLSVGSQEQRELHQAGDNMRIDWGYFHLIVPNDEHAQTALSYSNMAQFGQDGTLPQADDTDMPRVGPERVAKIVGTSGFYAPAH